MTNIQEKQNVENVAKAIYATFPDADEQPWVNGGDSDKQEEARRYALAAIGVQGRCKSQQVGPYEELEVDIKLLSTLNEVGGPLSESMPFSFVRAFAHHFAQALLTPKAKGS